MIVYRCPVCRQSVGLGVVNPVDHPPTCCRYPERIDADGTRRPGPTHRPTTMEADQ